MADHIVKITDETVLDYIRTIDGDADNTTLIQRVMDGHFTEWEKMFKVSKDRTLYERFQKLDPDTKAVVEATIEAAEAKVEILEKEAILERKIIK